MSTTLYWEPLLPPRHKPLPYELKKILGRKIWDHDGSLCEDPVDIGAAYIPYLQGLADGKVPGAQELIDALMKYGQVMLSIEE